MATTTPSFSPSVGLTFAPSTAPTAINPPTSSSGAPTLSPTISVSPSAAPSLSPVVGSVPPTSENVTFAPTTSPTRTPTTSPSLSPTSNVTDSPTTASPVVTQSPIFVTPAPTIDIIEFAQTPPGGAIAVFMLFLIAISVWMCCIFRRRRIRYRQVEIERANEQEMMRFNYHPDDARRIDVI